MRGEHDWHLSSLQWGRCNSLPAVMNLAILIQGMAAARGGEENTIVICTKVRQRHDTLNKWLFFG